jgi:hypothetical protein
MYVPYYSLIPSERLKFGLKLKAQVKKIVKSRDVTFSDSDKIRSNT